jgi:hypothetical protein
MDAHKGSIPGLICSPANSSTELVGENPEDIVSGTGYVFDDREITRSSGLGQRPDGQTHPPMSFRLPARLIHIVQIARQLTL